MSSFGKRVLIVEDGRTLNRTLQFLLRSRGYVIESAYNGKEALKIIKKVRPDVIILDLMMPEMDGFEFCEKLKNNNRLKGTPIIVLSALDPKPIMDRLISLGISDYVEKPFISIELLKKVSTALLSSVN